MAVRTARSTKKTPALDESRFFGGRERRQTWKEGKVMIRKIPFIYPRWNDARWIQILAHVTYAFLGQLAYAFEITPAEIAFVLIGCSVLDMAWNWFLRKIIIFPASGLIGGLGLVMFVRIAPEAPSMLLYGLAIVLTISSKYLLAYKTEGGKNHIFNPSNFGIVSMLLLFPGITFVRPDQWDPSIPLLCLLLALGITLVWRAKVFWLTFAFILAESVLYLIKRGGLEGVDFPWLMNAVTIYWLQLPTLLVFAFHMLNDPRTVPKSQMARTLHAIMVAVLHWLLLAFGFGRSAVFLAAFAVCLTGAVLRVAGPRFRKDPVPA